jgi:hypothetical protein
LIAAVNHLLTSDGTGGQADGALPVLLNQDTLNSLAAWSALEGRSLQIHLYDIEFTLPGSKSSSLTSLMFALVKKEVKGAKIDIAGHRKEQGSSYSTLAHVRY